MSEQPETPAVIIPFPRRKRTWLDDAAERAEERLLSIPEDMLGPAARRAVASIKAHRAGSEPNRGGR